jgi:hypothetical protein
MALGKTSVAVFGIAIVVALCTIGCSSARSVEPPAPPVDKTRLSHAQHAAIKCESCHRMGQRPGANDHAPCDDCHKQAFLSPPGELCKTCHTKVTAQPIEAPLRPYPSEDIWQSEPPRFSHALHMDFARMEGGVGFHVTCADCHVRDGKLARADHTACARCHAAEARVGKAPPMEKCDGCHDKGSQQRTRGRLIKGDLRFDHPRHQADRRGTPIKCEDCHTESKSSTSYADHAAPRIAACVGCHDDSERVPHELRMRTCETCHANRTQNLATIAPRDHLPATEKPLDHTLAFRRDHAEAASNGARCATCHTQMSGNSISSCDECHQTMRPADHRITFRELDHGTEAAANRDRCATCHVVEFCTACHSQRPRSHGFPGTFATEHGGLARINVRSCMTCHDQRRDCLACHERSTR